MSFSIGSLFAGIGGLWEEYRRIVQEIRPRFVVVENVASGKEMWLHRVRSDLHALGYRTRALQISAADVGLPHRRERIFVVANTYRFHAPHRTHGALHGKASFQPIPDHAGEVLPNKSGLGRNANGLPDRVDRAPTGRAQAQNAWEPRRVKHGVVMGGARLKALGNAVVPQVAESVGRVVMQIAEET